VSTELSRQATIASGQFVGIESTTARQIPCNEPSHREGLLSKRRRATRVAMDAHSNRDSLQDANTPSQQHLITHDHSQASQGDPLHDVRTHAASGARNGNVAVCSAMVVRDGPQESNQGFEPLIDSSEAARLLGNIHVKTLQRYARQRSVPGYQIGGHWYFRGSELDMWLRSRLNSNCQPADRVDLAQEEIP